MLTMPADWPHPSSPEISYFRDDRGEVFAAELVRGDRWEPAFMEPLDPAIADIRIVFVEHSARGAGVPGWIVVLPRALELQPAVVVESALRAWTHSPTFRQGGPSAEAYVVAGFQALCPPHPACQPGPGSRDSLSEFLRDRPGILGRLGDEGRDGFDRVARMTWPTPEAFAADVLRERIYLDGAGATVELAAFIEAAETTLDVPEFAVLAGERLLLLSRLHPERYFTEARDYDRAVDLGRDWRDRYRRAYEAHYRDVIRTVSETLDELQAALTAADTLETMNSRGRSVGGDAAARLVAAVEEIRTLPVEPRTDCPRTAGVVLGQMPAAVIEAQRAAAAVWAALDVQRRRSSAVSLG